MQFDFEGADARPATNTPEFTVSELSGKVKSTIETEFSYVRVRGELGRVSQPASGHIYLDLKDEKAVISGVIWRAKAARLAIRPEQGLEVIVTGKLTTFPGQSKYQIVIDQLEPAGQGALMALLEERKKKLASEGLMDESAKQKIPFMPRVVGIVTSPTGAVIRDMMHGFRERFPVHVMVWPVRVQGETAAREIAAGIIGFNQIKEGQALRRPDVLIVARGGGSLEDLWSFNEEIVARAAANSRIPLISAVGHETDWTLIDYVADARAPTPTKAAEWSVPKFSELTSRLADLKARQIKVINRSLETRRFGLKSAGRGLPRLVDLVGLPRQRLDGVSGRLAQGLLTFTRAKKQLLLRSSGRMQPFLLKHRLERGKERVAHFAQGLHHLMVRRGQYHRERLSYIHAGFQPRRIERQILRGREALSQTGSRCNRAFQTKVLRQRDELQRLGQLMNSLSYQSVLARGFTIVRDKAGGMVRQASHLSPEDQISIEFVDGQALAEIQSFSGVISLSDQAPIKKSAKGQSLKKKVKKTDDGDGGQGSLF